MSKLFVCNWKMYLSPDDEVALAEQVDKIPSDYDVIIAPTFLTLREIARSVASVSVASQSVSSAVSGACTAQISAKSLNACGCKYAIVGHSEVRALGISQAELDKCVHTALENGVIPIYCIGETEAEYLAGNTNQVLSRQLETLQNIPNLIIAYEPVWAIGTGRTPKLEEITQAMRFIKSVMQNAKVLYGGSVASNNFKEIITLNEVDGVLVGSASTKIDELNKMLLKVVSASDSDAVHLR